MTGAAALPQNGGGPNEDSNEKLLDDDGSPQGAPRAVLASRSFRPSLNNLKKGNDEMETIAGTPAHTAKGIDLSALCLDLAGRYRLPEGIVLSASKAQLEMTSPKWIPDCPRSIKSVCTIKSSCRE